MEGRGTEVATKCLCQTIFKLLIASLRSKKYTNRVIIELQLSLNNILNAE